MLFDQVTDLSICIPSNQIFESIKFILTLINISQLQHLSIRFIRDLGSADSPGPHIHSLLKPAENLNSVTIDFSWSCHQEVELLKCIIPVVNQNIKHFRIDGRLIIQMGELMKPITHLSSMTLRSLYGNRRFLYSYIFSDEQLMDSTYLISNDRISFWFDRNNNSSNEIFCPNKRLKTISKQ